jgi:hypothetical protein
MPDIENWINNESFADKEPVIEQKESIKLTKNAKGNFQWEIRILSLDVDELAEINDKLEKKFGGIIKEEK